MGSMSKKIRKNINRIEEAKVDNRRWFEKILDKTPLKRFKK